MMTLLLLQQQPNEMRNDTFVAYSLVADVVEEETL